MSFRSISTCLKLSFVILLLGWSECLEGQFNWTNWFFGNENSTSGLTFNSEFTDPIPSTARRPIDLSESNVMLTNTAVIVFYSNGNIALNNIGDIMPNGRNLKGSPSSLYGCTIADHPNFCEQYYLIYSEPEEVPASRGVYYSVVDINIVVEGLIADANGDIIPSQKDILITPQGFDAAESIYSLNKSVPKEGSWLFLSERNSGDILIYEVSIDGINLHQQIKLADLIPGFTASNINNIIFESVNINNEFTKLAIATIDNNLSGTSIIATVDFDRGTGTFLDNTSIIVSQNRTFTYSTAFSPDGSKLYYTDHINKTLYQYDFIMGTNLLIGTSSHSGKSGGLKLGPNNRIYWANKFNIEPNNQPISSISVVVSPNLPGLSCNLQLDNVSIATMSLPTKIGVFPVNKMFDISPFLNLQSEAECGQENGVVQIISNQNLFPLSIEWDNGENTLVASNLSKGIHKVTMTTLDNCVYEDSILVTELSDFQTEDLSYQSENPSACTMTDGNINFSSSSFLLDSTYRISYSNENNENFIEEYRVTEDQNLLIQNLSVGKYFDITVESTYAICPLILGDTISLTGLSQKPNLGQDTILCQNNPLIIRPEAEYENYIWSDGSTENNIIITESGNYILNVKDDIGCENADTIVVIFADDIDLELAQGLEIESGQTIQIIPNVNQQAGTLNFNWSPPEFLSCTDCFDPFASPDSSTTFQLIVTDENICADTSFTNIKVNEYTGLYLPNVFTPNNDGSDNQFKIEGGTSDISEIITFTIFDRWGQRVYDKRNFEVSDPNIYWNGTIGSEDAVPGVYVYMVEMRLINGEIRTQKGDILLAK